MSDNISQNISTDGGSSVHGNVNTGRDFIGRDQTIGTQINVYNSSFLPQRNTSYSILIVDTMHRGDFSTIGAAITGAKPGDKIIIQPGVYDEGFVIDKPLEIEGAGKLGDVVVQATGKPVIRFQTSTSQVRNLTLRQNGDDKIDCVDITQGRLLLEGCDLSGHGRAIVTIRGGASPTVRNNRIHDSKAVGILVFDQGQGVVEDNDIFAIDHTGIEIGNGGNPTIRNNRIYKTGGIDVHDQGQAIIEANDIYENSYSGIHIRLGSNATVRNNRIHNCPFTAIIVDKQGQGLIENNEIFANKTSVSIADGGNPTVRNNRIYDSGDGVFVFDRGQGIVEDNEIYANAIAGVVSYNGGNPTVRNNRIYQNNRWAIAVVYKSGGVFEGNDLRNNREGAWEISTDSIAHVTRRNNQE